MDDPYRSYNFLLQIEGVTVGGFVSVSEIAANTEVIAYREGGGAGGVRHLPGQVDYSPVTLRYGLTQNRELWDWFRSVRDGQPDRRNVSVIQLEPDGATEALRWNLFNAWPAQFTAGPMDALSSAVAIESVTLVFDRLERD